MTHNFLEGIFISRVIRVLLISLAPVLSHFNPNSRCFSPEFCSLGGLEVVLNLLGHRWPPLRARAARLLGSCAQNLPAAQGQALALGALPALLGALQRDPDPRVAPAALFAVSCLVRAQPEGLQQLEALGGLEVLGGALQSPHPLRGPAPPSCCTACSGSTPASKFPWCSRAWCRGRRCCCVRFEHNGAHEHGLGVLCSLASGCPEGLRECRDPI
ncbi:hsp70-binding protein 1 [Ammospiza maritima maritima]